MGHKAKVPAKKASQYRAYSAAMYLHHAELILAEARAKGPKKDRKRFAETAEAVRELRRQLRELGIPEFRDSEV